MNFSYQTLSDTPTVCMSIYSNSVAGVALIYRHYVNCDGFLTPWVSFSSDELDENHDKDMRK